MSPGIQTSSHSSVQLPTGAGTPCQKPVMRVSPMTDSPQRTSVDGVVFTTGTTKYSALLLEALSILVTLQFHMLNDFIVWSMKHIDRGIWKSTSVENERKTNDEIQKWRADIKMMLNVTSLIIISYVIFTLCFIISRHLSVHMTCKQLLRIQSIYDIRLNIKSPTICGLHFAFPIQRPWLADWLSFRFIHFREK